MRSKQIAIDQIKENPDNPRVIKDKKFKELVKSIKDFPKMLELRPIVVDDNMIVLGGNMRLKACIEAGLEKVPVIVANELTEEEKKEFIVKDNLAFGEWNWEALSEQWDQDLLSDWGMDLPEWDEGGEDDKRYTMKIKSPVYEIKGEEPKINQLTKVTRLKQLLKRINSAEVPEDIKEFLKLAAYRHVVFDYEKIAEFYAHADKEVQELMEDSALVIVDFDKAIEMGFVSLSEDIAEGLKGLEHEEEE